MHCTAKSGNKSGKSKIGPFMTVIYGLQVIVSEGKWLMLNAIRKFEISRLLKRLDEENALLGGLLASSTDTPPFDSKDTPDALPCTAPQAKIALKQILFLKEEIAYLQRDRENMRQEFNERRKKKLGLA